MQVRNKKVKKKRSEGKRKGKVWLSKKKKGGVPRPVTVVVPGRRERALSYVRTLRSLLEHLLSEKRKSWQSAAGWMCHSAIDSEWRRDEREIERSFFFLFPSF